jgi:hypothetical protein
MPIIPDTQKGSQEARNLEASLGKGIRRLPQKQNKNKGLRVWLK